MLGLGLHGAGLLCAGLGCGDRSSEPADPPAPAVEPGPASEDGEPPAPPPGAFAQPGLADWRPRERLGWPVQSVHITSSFGWRVDPVTGRGTRLHRGMDFRGAIGDLVLSIGAGRVRFVGHDPLLGNMVIIDHGDGLESLYGHLSDVLVVAEVQVQRGAAIGLVGNTGRSAAPHLHLTIKLDGTAIDPLEVLGEPPHRPDALVAPPPAPAVAQPPGADGTAEASTGTISGPADTGSQAMEPTRPAAQTASTGDADG